MHILTSICFAILLANTFLNINKPFIIQKVCVVKKSFPIPTYLCSINNNKRPTSITMYNDTLHASWKWAKNNFLLLPHYWFQRALVPLHNLNVLNLNTYYFKGDTEFPSVPPIYPIQPEAANDTIYNHAYFIWNIMIALSILMYETDATEPGIVGVCMWWMYRIVLYRMVYVLNAFTFRPKTLLPKTLLDSRTLTIHI